jgi:cupin superfamily acireductone dioxygenase involved in methionine salvage
MVDSKKQLNIRISAELYNKIESEDRSKQDIISDALLLYFDSKNKLNVANELEHEKEKTRLLENNIKDLQQQIGFLTQDHIRISGQLDRLLMPSKEEITKKNWWQFWK